MALAGLLAGAACSGPIGEEPLYVLRDSLGRSVAMAGRSQLGDAAPGSMVRASVGGLPQDLMVGERVGTGPVVPPAPVPQAPSPVAEAGAAAAPSAITTTALEAPASDAGLSAEGRSQGRRAAAGGGQGGAAQAGVNPAGRRAGPPPRSASRSVM